tara:strand:+ start:279 stop:545 length:267 start_codon:yes stop_codon:yes gene_type:complete
MANPFKGYEFKEEAERKMVLDNFRYLYSEKAEIFPRLKLVMIYNAYKDRLEDFDMSLGELKAHLDALVDSPNNDLGGKNDEYFMGGVI